MNISTEHILQGDQSEPSGRIVDLMNENAAMVVEEIHVEDIFQLVYSVLSLIISDILLTSEQSLIISWAFRILAHEKDQYTVMFRKY